MTAVRAGVTPWRQPQRRHSTSPAKSFTIDRRLAVQVNRLGHGQATTYDRLTDAQRRRFDAQLAAWRAACDLAEVYTDSAAYGIPIPPSRRIDETPESRWLTARRSWERVR